MHDASRRTQQSMYSTAWYLRWPHTSPRFPERVVVEGSGDLLVTPVPAGVDEDDFFSSWNKPATPNSPAFISSKPVPPILGRAASIPSANGSTPPASPRTISSSSLRSAQSSAGSRPNSMLGASRLTSSSPAASTPTAAPAPRKSKLGGLGAKKAVAPLDFAEAERRAAEEAERVRQLGYDREQERKEEERARKEAEAAPQSAKAPPKSAKAVPTTPVSALPTGNAQDLERLGMGMKRLGFGAVPAAPSTSKARCVLLLNARLADRLTDTYVLQRGRRGRADVRAGEVRETEGDLVGHVLRAERVRPVGAK